MRKFITLRSPAKINLFLEVLGKRSDGYHEIVTVMQEVGLFDTLQITEQPAGITVRTDHADLPTDRRNLVYQAAALLKKRYKIKQGVLINISKNIPLGGGLGGGSSNAAYTLKGLNQLWRLGLKNEELYPLAATLGSDVPFFISGGLALCKGRGEIVFPLPYCLSFTCLLVYPGFPVSTRKIYGNLPNFPLTKPRRDVSIFTKNLLGKIPTLVFNRLEETVLRCYPAVRRLRANLVRTGKLVTVQVSGSGASVFGILNPQMTPLLDTVRKDGSFNIKGGDGLIRQVGIPAGGKAYFVKPVAP